MNPKERKEWKQIRAKGFGRYVLLKGILEWGFGLSTISIAVKIIYPILFSQPEQYTSTLMWEWLLAIIFFSILGSIIVVVKWIRNEDKYFWSTGTEAEERLTNPERNHIRD